MVSRVLLAIVALASLASSQAAIDFTAVPEDYVFEGVRFQRLRFNDDTGSISIGLPAKWSYRSSKDRLQLVSPSPANAEGTIQAVVLRAPEPLDEKATTAIVAQALASAPPASQQVNVIAQQENALMIEGHDSFEVTTSFFANGSLFHSSTTVVNYPDHRLVLRFTAPKETFAGLYGTFRRAVSAWEFTKSGAATAQAAAADPAS